MYLPLQFSFYLSVIWHLAFAHHLSADLVYTFACTVHFHVLYICAYFSLYTARKINWWRYYCLAVCDKIVDNFLLFDKTLRHIELCKSVFCQIQRNPPFLRVYLYTVQASGFLLQQQVRSLHCWPDHHTRGTVVMYSSTALQHKCTYKLLLANLDNCNELKACFMIYKGILAIARFGS